MNSSPSRVVQGGYRALWRVMEVVLRVPRTPPRLPVLPGSSLESFRPSRAFLRYLKFWYWCATLPLGVLLLAAWIVSLVFIPVLGLLLLIPFTAAVVSLAAPYLALYLRVDSTWYVVSDRSMRIRRGIWIIRETTITFENVQDVAVRQGPIERYFKIAHLTVQTAGGGSDPRGQSQAHVGILEGLDNAAEMRDLVLARVRASRSAGLGDERTPVGDTRSAPRAIWGPGHLEALREIRDLAVALAGRSG